MKFVYFVRHAQPDYRTGDDDYTFALSDEGMMDRYEAARVLEDVKIDKAYCSPYKRALQTIQPIVDSNGLTIVTDERLRERVHGNGGNNFEMFRRRWEDKNWHEPGGESISEVQARFADAMSEIIDNSCEQENILIGTHGTALCALINYYRPDFGIDDFIRIIDYMPWVVRAAFSGKELLKLEEICFVRKEYHGAE